MIPALQLSIIPLELLIFEDKGSEVMILPILTLTVFTSILIAWRSSLQRSKWSMRSPEGDSKVQAMLMWKAEDASTLAGTEVDDVEEKPNFAPLLD